MEIKPCRSKRYFSDILFIGVFSLITFVLRGADAPITSIGTINDAVPGQLVTVPIKVAGFNKIGSFYLYLEYDYTKLQFSSVTKNPILTGSFDIKDHDLGDGNHRIILSWSGGLYGISLADGSSMVDFVFKYIAGEAVLKWNTASDNYCAYTDPQVNRLNDIPKLSFYVNGEVSGFTPSAPVVDSIAQPTYEISTGSVFLTGLPAGNWTINPGGIAGTGSSFTISGLSEGTYNFTVTNTAGYTSAPTANVVINSQPVTAISDNFLNTINARQELSVNNYPNPFSKNTTLIYGIPYDGRVTIVLFNHLGQQVDLLFDEAQCSGKYSLSCNFNELQPGIYIARIMLSNKVEKISNTIKISVLD